MTVHLDTSSVTDGHVRSGTGRRVGVVVADMQHLTHLARRPVVVAVATLLLAALTACSSGGTDPEPEQQGPDSTETQTEIIDAMIDLPTGPDAVVLQVDERVNQPDPFPIAAAYPAFTLYGDGTVVYRDRAADPSALPPLMQAEVSPAGMQLLMAEAIDAGVFDSPDTGFDRDVADASSVYIRATADGRSVAYTIGDNEELDDLTDRLELDWADIVGDEILAEPLPYAFESVLVVARQDRADVAATDVPRLPIDLRQADEIPTRVLPVRCVELSAGEFDEIRALADTITTPNGSTWRSGTATGTPGAGLWYVLFRPVLPHETDCELIAAQ